MPEPLRGSDSIVIDAPPEVVWGMVSDVTRMGEWSPETQSASWSGASTASAVGATFAGKNRRGPVRWTGRCEVTVSEPGREFTFVRKGPDGGTTWRYLLEPAGSSTKVTESFTQTKLPPPPVRLVGRVLFGADRQTILLNSVKTTLGRLKSAAESPGK